MKIFSPAQSPALGKKEEIISALRIAVERQWGGLHHDQFLSLTHDTEDQFFLKSAQRYIFWGKIFFEPLTLERTLALKKEQEELSKKFLQPLKLHIFFPQMAGNEPCRTYAKAEYFQYSLMESLGEKAMLLTPVSFSLSEHIPLKETTEIHGEAVRMEPISRQSQLTRNELAELIDLSLELKRS